MLMNDRIVEVIRDQAAIEVLDEHTFVQAWDELWRRTPHATVYQSPAFVRSWYSSYRETYAPVIVRSKRKGAGLDGLWMLAWNDRGRRLVHAGDHQAEYHVWLATADASEEFVTIAWRLLAEQFNFEALRFKYLPSDSLTRLLSRIPTIAGRMIATTRQRPLLRLNKSEIEASFAKKSNRSRFNRLRRLGKLEFEHVAASPRLAELFDDIIAHYDFRQGAVHGTTPFADDPHKRAFHFALLDRSPETSHLTVTTIDRSPVAALWGFMTRDTLHVGLFAYSPLLGSHSPGKLHLMQLERYLAECGVEVLDLTPGDDQWKERFANDHDFVADVMIYRTLQARRRADTSRALLRIARASIRKLGWQPAEVRAVFRTMQEEPFSAVARRARRFFRDVREFRVYRADRSSAERCQLDERVHENSLAALLRFEPSERWQSRSDFLGNALRRLEVGESVFTVTIDGRLAHSGWCVRQQLRSHSSEVNQSFTMPGGSVVLYDFQSAPDYRCRGLYRATIGHILRNEVRDAEAKHFYISVLADNGPSRHVIESMGFIYQGSLYERQRFGFVSRWKDAVFDSVP